MLARAADHSNQDVLRALHHGHRRVQPRVAETILPGHAHAPLDILLGKPPHRQLRVLVEKTFRVGLAEAAACDSLRVLGAQDDERLRRGVRVLTRNLPTAENGRTHVYYWYYAAQVCHHMEGEPWRKWNETMRETLPALQIREGKERGSWDPTVDVTVGVGGGGRLFVTCLATYMLEVYYRHLPIYQLDLLQSGH